MFITLPPSPTAHAELGELKTTEERLPWVLDILFQVSPRSDVNKTFPPWPTTQPILSYQKLIPKLDPLEYVSTQCFPPSVVLKI